MGKVLEKWRPVLNYEGFYEVGNLGNVKSLSRLTKGRWGNMKLSPGRILKPGKLKLGYLRVDLSKNGETSHKLVHRLVAEAFIKPLNGRDCINHKDSDRANNAVENLEWCTHRENTAHAISMGRMRFPDDKARRLSRAARNRNYEQRQRAAQAFGVKE